VDAHDRAAVMDHFEHIEAARAHALKPLTRDPAELA
jgi:hypothetical protein